MLYGMVIPNQQLHLTWNSLRGMASHLRLNSEVQIIKSTSDALFLSKFT
uniref:Uncharacterized protein n=1 Tax=Rhizophora mucronata TaxID=61149 RepID=A0A2P2LN95_RHIMU